MHHHSRGVEELGDTQAIAGRAGADGGIEREKTRLELGQRVIADRAAVLGREQQRCGIRLVKGLHRGHAVAEFQRGLEAFGQALFDVLARLETVDNRFDGVLLAQGQRGHRVDFVKLAVHAYAHVTLRPQLVEDLGVFAFAFADHRGQHHVALFAAFGGHAERQHLVDHLADSLGFQRIAMVGAARQADARVQQAQVVVDLGDRADGGARVVRGGLLFDRNRRGQSLDVVDIGFLHHAEELACVGR